MFFAREIKVNTINKLLLMLLLIFGWGIVNAHPPGLSSAELALNAKGLDAKLTFSIQDIEAFVPMDSDQDAEVTAAEMATAKPKIAELIAHEFRLSINQVVITPANPGTVEFDDQNNAHLEFQYLTDINAPVVINAEFLHKFSTGHRHFVTFKDLTGHLIGEKMLTQQDSQIIQDVTVADKESSENFTATTHSASFVDFLKLGIEHILTGYDHLLFLFSLLVITHSFWPALKVITFFTVAHSITLAFASLNLIELPSSIVEPLIAATIIYVGLENIVRKGHPKGRGMLTFFFGLIHGFGFASVLREMGISTNGTDIFMPLFSFNLGVELGQITVAAIVLPLIWWLHTKPLIEPRLTPVCSVMACLAGGYWLIERTLLT